MSEPLPRLKDFCAEDRPKARAIYTYMKELLLKLSEHIAARRSEGEQLVPLGKIFEVVDAPLEGEQALIVAKIRELEREASG